MVDQSIGLAGLLGRGLVFVASGLATLGPLLNEEENILVVYGRHFFELCLRSLQ